jgi:CarD family transcriptional regulator
MRFSCGLKFKGSHRKRLGSHDRWSLMGGGTLGAGSSAAIWKGVRMATKALSFDVGDYVVYPKHGVGRVVELQSTEIAGASLELYVLRFEKEKMTLRVPVLKADSVGMRKLSSDKTMKDALETLKGKPKVKRTMWSRRAQEYEAKINSGDLTSIAEVTRDLFRPDDAPEQSYSERQIFEAASSRLARELGAMEQTDEKSALAKILDILNKAWPIHNKAKEVA